MPEAKEPVRIKLTAEQQEMIRRMTGMKADAIELTVEELEERLAPMKVAPRK